MLLLLAPKGCFFLCLWKPWKPAAVAPKAAAAAAAAAAGASAEILLLSASMWSSPRGHDATAHGVAHGLAPRLP